MSPRSTRVLQSGDTLQLGRFQSVRFGSLPDSCCRGLIYVFSTTCGFCKKSFPIWNQIEATETREGVRVIGISLDSADSTSNMIRQTEAAFPVFVTIEPERFKSANDISGVPQTMLINPNGVVTKVWMGLVSEDVAAEVVNAISKKTTNIQQTRRTAP